MAKSLHTKQHRMLVDCLVGYRERRGLTQSELARRLGRYQSVVAAMEVGRRLDLVELLELSEVLEFDIPELVDVVKGVAG